MALRGVGVGAEKNQFCAVIAQDNRVTGTVLAANPGLAELGAVLPHGTAVELPDVQTAPVAETVNLWE